MPFPDDHSRTWCTSCYERAACDEISDYFGGSCSDAWNPPLCRTVCNHFIAFKLLAIIRHQVFAVLRKLCPAKLDGREKGNLISIITTDIELLEVFYAHTISPIMIAILTSLIMVVFIGRFHVYAGIFAVCSYLLVGCVIPLRNGKKGGQKGMEFRSGFGNLNSFVLESLRGIDETIQYGQGKKRKAQISEKSIELGKMQKDLNRMEAMQRAVTDFVILCCSFGMFFLMYHLYQAGNVTFDAMLLATIAMMGSFGPVTALSSLSNNLNQTLASGERVLSLLEEEPMVEESEGEADISFESASVEDVTFAYDEEVILKDCNINMKQGKVIGICGKMRLRKVHTVETSDALLGCKQRKHKDFRRKRERNPNQDTKKHTILRNSGNRTLPRLHRQ